MGKACKLKKIRKVAKGLPALERKTVVGINLTGAELIKGGVTTVKEKEVDEKEMYHAKRTVRLPVNHARAMKKLYNKNGIKGVSGYIDAVNNFANVHR
jgi:hypothetical protein